MSHSSTTGAIPVDFTSPTGHSIVAAAPLPPSDAPHASVTFRSFDPARGEHHGPTIHAAPASAVVARAAAWRRSNRAVTAAPPGGAGRGTLPASAAGSARTA